MVSRKGPPTLPKPRRGAAVRATNLLGKLAGCPFHGVRREAMRRCLADHPPENGARLSLSTPVEPLAAVSKQPSRFLSRRFPLDVAKAPFDNHAGPGFTVDDDLGAAARPIRRREKNALLDAYLPSRCFEKPSSPVRQDTKHGTALPNPL